MPERPGVAIKHRATPGCYKTEDGHFRAIVIVAHDGLYLSEGRAVDTALFAIRWAEQAIQNDFYREWHYHKLVVG